jgi:hypothetical protein
MTRSSKGHPSSDTTAPRQLTTARLWQSLEWYAYSRLGYLFLREHRYAKSAAAHRCAAGCFAADPRTREQTRELVRQAEALLNADEIEQAVTVARWAAQMTEADNDLRSAGLAHSSLAWH